jgi:predicted DNA-binding transcriptional regulator AlpA
MATENKVTELSRPMVTSDTIRTHFGFSEAQFGEFRKRNPDFPAPLAIGTRLLRFDRQSVETWIARKAVEALEKANPLSITPSRNF